MMGRALWIIGALATLGFLASGVLGYLLRNPVDPGLPRHVLVGLSACLAQLFSHCWILVYLIFTGRAIRETVEEHGLDAAWAEAPRRFLRSTAPWLIAAIGLGIAAFLLGGASATAAVRPWVHHTSFYLLLAVQGIALWQEYRVLRANQSLIDEIDRQIVPAGHLPSGQAREVAG